MKKMNSIETVLNHKLLNNVELASLIASIVCVDSPVINDVYDDEKIASMIKELLNELISSTIKVSYKFKSNLCNALTRVLSLNEVRSTTNEISDRRKRLFRNICTMMKSDSAKELKNIMSDLDYILSKYTELNKTHKMDSVIYTIMLQYIRQFDAIKPALDHETILEDKNKNLHFENENKEEKIEGNEKETGTMGKSKRKNRTQSKVKTYTSTFSEEYIRDKENGTIDPNARIESMEAVKERKEMVERSKQLKAANKEEHRDPNEPLRKDGKFSSKRRENVESKSVSSSNNESKGEEVVEEENNVVEESKETIAKKVAEKAKEIMNKNTKNVNNSVLKVFKDLKAEDCLDKIVEVLDISIDNLLDCISSNITNESDIDYYINKHVCSVFCAYVEDRFMGYDETVQERIVSTVIGNPFIQSQDIFQYNINEYIPTVQEYYNDIVCVFA